MVIRFRPGKLGEKLDPLTCRVDYYPKRGSRDYMLANPQNLRPIFSQERLATSLHTTYLHETVLDAASLVNSSIPIVDSALLIKDIKAAYSADPVTSWELNLCLNGTSSPRFSLTSSGLLLLGRCIYVPGH